MTSPYKGAVGRKGRALGTIGLVLSGYAPVLSDSRTLAQGCGRGDFSAGKELCFAPVAPVRPQVGPSNGPALLRLLTKARAHSARISSVALMVSWNDQFMRLVKPRRAQAARMPHVSPHTRSVGWLLPGATCNGVTRTGLRPLGCTPSSHLSMAFLSRSCCAAERARRGRRWAACRPACVPSCTGGAGLCRKTAGVKLGVT